MTTARNSSVEQSMTATKRDSMPGRLTGRTVGALIMKVRMRIRTRPWDMTAITSTWESINTTFAKVSVAAMKMAITVATSMEVTRMDGTESSTTVSTLS